MPSGHIGWMPALKYERQVMNPPERVPALRRRRNDLAAMILKSAWWTREIDPVEALCTGDVELVKSMILIPTVGHVSWRLSNGAPRSEPNGSDGTAANTGRLAGPGRSGGRLRVRR